MELPGHRTIPDRTNIVREDDSVVKKEFRKYSFVMALIIIGTAGFSMLGWIFDIEIFKRPLPDLDAMNPMSALAWIFLGLSLFLQVDKYSSSNSLLISRILAVIASIGGVLRLAEIVTHYTIRVNYLFFSNVAGDNAADADSMHMSSATALSLVLIGLTLFLSSFENKRIKYFGNYSALVVFVIGLFSIIAHAYQVHELTGFLIHFSMSIYTASCFFLISLAVMFVNSEVGFMRTFSSHYLGGTMSRLLIPSAILIPLFLGFVRLLANWRYAISVELGVTLLISSIIFIFYALIWFLAAALNRSDIGRTAAEAKLRKLNEDLEQKIKTRTDELDKSEKRFRSLVENNDDIIALLDEELKSIYRSPSAEQITGWTDEERGLISGLALIHPDDKETIAEIVKAALNNPGKVYNITMRTKKKNGSYIWLQGTITNKFNDPSVGAIISNLQDITLRKEAEERLAKLHEELENKIAERTAELQNAIKDLESFGYTVSHDLRTPLQVISAYSSVLAKKHCAANDADAQAIVQEIKDYTRQMSRIIESLLHLSQSGREVIEKIKVDMNEMVSKVIAELKVVNKDAITEQKINPLPPAFCDEGLVKLVWMNLISNAIKYSRKAIHPFIEIGANELNGETVYYVKDNGVGFDMQDAGKLFGAFQRLNQAAEFEGSGIGLAIVHRIVTRHGGRIWAESKKDEGAAFYFTLAPKQEKAP